VVEGLGYEPTVVRDEGGDAPEAPDRIAIEKLPTELQRLFAEARKSARFVLLDFTEPG